MDILIKITDNKLKQKTVYNLAQRIRLVLDKRAQLFIEGWEKLHCTIFIGHTINYKKVLVQFSPAFVTSNPKNGSKNGILLGAGKKSVKLGTVVVCGQVLEHSRGW